MYIKEIKSNFKKCNNAFTGQLYAQPQSSSTRKELRNKSVGLCFSATLYVVIYALFSTILAVQDCSGKCVMSAVNWKALFNCTASLKRVWLNIWVNGNFVKQAKPLQ